MTHVTYELIEHDGGWAYRVGAVYSETYPSHDLARAAADRAAHRQQRAGETTDIEYEDAGGRWRHELAQAGDRPETEVVDRPGGGPVRDAVFLADSFDMPEQAAAALVAGDDADEVAVAARRQRNERDALADAPTPDEPGDERSPDADETRLKPVLQSQNQRQGGG